MTLPIYLISLQKDGGRREKLKERFPLMYNDFIKIEAIDGRNLSAKEYFEKTKLFYDKQKRQMFPAELGCSLSHIKALSAFMSSGESHAIIIEDDIIGDDTDLDFINNFTENNASECIIFCGCQEGVLNRYKYGKPMGEGVVKVANCNRGNYSRTAAYVVSRKAAQCILNFHCNIYITVADFWMDLLADFDGNVFYIARLTHEMNLSESNIERDRLDMRLKSLRQLTAFNLLKKVYIRAINEIRKLYFEACGSINIETIK